MAEKILLDDKVPTKDMNLDDLYEFSNIFASEFNSSDIHDRMLCFQFIEDDELFESNVGSKDNDEGKTESDHELSVAVNSTANGAHAGENDGSKDGEDDSDEDTVEGVEENNKSKRNSDPKEDEMEAQDEQKQEQDAEKHGEIANEDQSKDGKSREDVPRNPADTEIKSSGTDNQTDDEATKSTARKLFVHSQWLAVQSPYFKALFYSGMKETFSKEVVMKIYEHELQAHLTFIEAMYKLDVLNDKDYHLVIQVLVLAHKYDASHVIKKCKYVLLSTTPSLEMCEYTLKEIAHLSDMAAIYDMLEKFLVKEFTPIDKTWTTKKFTELSKAAVKLLLGSDSLATQSENTIFVALMKWVRSEICFCFCCQKCDLLDVVRFEFMSVDFLYDVVQGHYVASKMPGYNKYLLKGLAYHGFSKTRRELLVPKPRKRPVLPQDDGPTFSWIIDDELQENLSESPGVPVFSNEFWYQGYSMNVQLGFGEDLTTCSLYLTILNLKGEAYLNVIFGAKSSLFVSRSVHTMKRLYEPESSSLGHESVDRNQIHTGKDFTIDVWVKIYEEDDVW